MDTTTAFQNIRQTLDAIIALQPMDGKAYRVGTSLTIRQLDGSGTRYLFQHVSGGTMRAVRQRLEGLTEVAGTTRTPLSTDVAVADYLRAMLVEVLK